MGKKRQEFSDKIIRNTAERVAFICSRPGCNQITIGPSDDGKSYKSGQGCHIYAASPNGPRADPSISKDYLKSEDNCIWLCVRCHNMVDSNPKIYPSSVLKEWKEKAEERARELNKDHRTCDIFFDKNKSIDDINGTFDSLFKDGNFDVISSLLSNSLNSKIISSEANQCLILNKFKYDSFCSRKALQDDINQILSFPQELINVASSFAISTYDVETCAMLSPYCSSNMKQTCVAIGKNNPKGILFFSNKENLEKSIGLQDKKILNSAIGYGSYICGYPTKDDSDKPIFVETDWTLKIFASISRLLNQTFQEHPNFIDLNNDPDAKNLSSNFGNILKLDDYYQDLILPKLFSIFKSDKKTMSNFYAIISSTGSISKKSEDFLYFSDDELQKTDNLSKFINLAYCGCSISLSKFLVEKDPTFVVGTLDGEFSLLKIDPILLGLYCEEKKRIDSSFNSFLFANNTYQGDLNNLDYHYVLANCASMEKDPKGFEKEVSFIKSHLVIVDFCKPEYLRLFSQQNEFAFLSKITKENKYSFIIGLAAKYLLKSHDNKYLQDATNAFLTLKENGYSTREGDEALISLFSGQGEYTKALKLAENELIKFNEHKYDNNICSWRLSLDNNQIDEVIKKIENKAQSSQTFVLLSTIYENAKDIEKSKEMALLGIDCDNSDKENPCLKQLWWLEITCPSKKADESKNFCLIRLDDDSLSFFIVPDLMAKHFKRGTLFGYGIKTESLSSGFFFLKVGSKVTINGKEHVVIEVSNIYSALARMITPLLSNFKDVKAFKLGPKGHEFDDITSFVNESKKTTQEAINFYARNDIPASLFSQMTGRNIVDSIAFLFLSEELKTISFENSHSAVNARYLLDFGSIFLLVFCGISVDDLRNTECFIVNSIKEIVKPQVSHSISSIDEGKSQMTLSTNSESKLVKFSQTETFKREYRSILSSILAFIDRLEILPNVSCYSKELDQLLTAMQEHHILIEKETLQNSSKDITLVTNNRFLRKVESSSQTPIMDFSSFLSLLPISTSKKIKAIERLQLTNMYIYFTITEYIQLKDEIEALNNKNRSIEEDELIALIKGSWKLFSNVEKDRHDNNLILICSKVRDSFTNHMSRITEALCEECKRIDSKTSYEYQWITKDINF